MSAPMIKKDIEKRRRFSQGILDINPDSLRLLASGAYGNNTARTETLLKDFKELQAFVKAKGQHRIVYAKVKSGTVTVGAPIRLSKALFDTFAFPGTTAISSVEMSSDKGRKASSDGHLRNFVVGDVVRLQNNTQYGKVYKDDWFVLIVSLNAPSTTDSKVLGVGRWLHGQECIRTAGGGKHYTFDSEREVYLSDYPFEIRLDTIIGRARLLPGFLDSGRKDDLVFNQYYKHVEKTVHHLTPPKVGRSEDLTKVLTLYRSVALRMQPVRKYLLTDILMLFLQRAFRMVFRARFCAYPLSDTLCDILHHALGNSTAVTSNNSICNNIVFGVWYAGHGVRLRAPFEGRHQRLVLE